MGLLINLVTSGVERSLSAGSEASVRVLCDVLVGLFGSGRAGTSNGLLDVVGGVPGRMVRLSGVGEGLVRRNILDGIHYVGCVW